MLLVLFFLIEVHIYRQSIADKSFLRNTLSVFLLLNSKAIFWTKENSEMFYSFILKLYVNSCYVVIQPHAQDARAYIPGQEGGPQKGIIIFLCGDKIELR